MSQPVEKKPAHPLKDQPAAHSLTDKYSASDGNSQPKNYSSEESQSGRGTSYGQDSRENASGTSLNADAGQADSPGKHGPQDERNPSTDAKGADNSLAANNEPKSSRSA